MTLGVVPVCAFCPKSACGTARAAPAAAPTDFMSVRREMVMVRPGEKSGAGLPRHLIVVATLEHDARADLGLLAVLRGCVLSECGGQRVGLERAADAAKVVAAEQVE